MRKIPLQVILLSLVVGHAALGSGVELNGITSLFGEKTACFTMDSATGTKAIGFSLEEGRSRFGIKLLEVDILKRRVQIEENGVLKFLSLCAEPELTSPTATDSGDANFRAGSGAGDQMQVRQFLQHDEASESIRTGNVLIDPTYVGAPYPNAAAPGSTSSETKSGDQSNTFANASLGGVGTSSSATDYKKQYWYIESLTIERNRLATANEVINGTSEPLARTPLTPASTPDILVGKETLFANHFSDFLVTDLSTD